MIHVCIMKHNGTQWLRQQLWWEMEDNILGPVEMMGPNLNCQQSVFTQFFVTNSNICSLMCLHNGIYVVIIEDKKLEHLVGHLALQICSTI